MYGQNAEAVSYVSTHDLPVLHEACKAMYCPFPELPPHAQPQPPGLFFVDDRRLALHCRSLTSSDTSAHMESVVCDQIHALLGEFVAREHVRHNKSGIAHRGRTKKNH
jgi:hypothetical protein